ncbi:MAG: hypothetical protein ACOC6F_00965 [bacterium]
MHVDVSSSGAILLGDHVTCDGFMYGRKVRVQTHVHKDHMSDFETSKGYQKIIMSVPTLDLLIAEQNADIPYRDNVHAAPTGQTVYTSGHQIVLHESGHMLGAVQVAVILPNGLRCGYSGDFAWPLEHVIQVDELVIDSTYGSPDSVRSFGQTEANDIFTNLVVDRVRSGPVLIWAHRGTLQRAITCLDDAMRCPIIVSRDLQRELEVYKQHGYGLTQVVSDDTDEAQLALEQNRYVRLYRTRERRSMDPTGATSIVLSAYLSSMRGPLVAYSSDSFVVGLSDHADYLGTVEYVRATGAKKVLTDNTRGGHAIELALALRQELGIDARPGGSPKTNQWGD